MAKGVDTSITTSVMTKHGRKYWETYEVIDGDRIRGGSSKSKSQSIANFEKNKKAYIEIIYRFMSRNDCSMICLPFISTKSHKY